MSIFDNNRHASFGIPGVIGHHPINSVSDEEKTILKELDELKAQLLDQANKLNAFLSKNNAVLTKFGIVPNTVIQHQGNKFQLNVSLDSGYVQNYITERVQNWNNPLGAYQTPWATPMSQQYGATGNPYDSLLKNKEERGDSTDSSCCKGHKEYPYTFSFRPYCGDLQDSICELDPTDINNYKTIFDFDWVSVDAPLIGIHGGSKITVNDKTFFGTLSVTKDGEPFDVTRSVLPFDESIDTPAAGDRQEFPRKFYEDLYRITRDMFFKKKTGCTTNHILNGTLHDEHYTVRVNGALYLISPRALVRCQRLPKGFEQEASSITTKDAE